MKIDSIMVGPIMTNCYLLSDETAGVCALIDPGDEAPRVLDMVARSGCQLQYILLTHGHFDHTTAVRPILEQYPDLPVYINEKDVVDGRVGDMELVFSRLPDLLRRHPVPLLLRPDGLRRRRLSGDAAIPGPPGESARVLPGLPRPRPAHHPGL